MVVNSWRVVNHQDPIPLIVPFTYHTRQEIFYNTSEKITPHTDYNMCWGNEVNGT